MSRRTVDGLERVQGTGQVDDAMLFPALWYGAGARLAADLEAIRRYTAVFSTVRLGKQAQRMSVCLSYPGPHPRPPRALYRALGECLGGGVLAFI